MNFVTEGDNIDSMEENFTINIIKNKRLDH